MNILEKNPDTLHCIISDILELHTFLDAFFPFGSPIIFRVCTRGIWKVMHIDPYNFTK